VTSRGGVGGGGRVFSTIIGAVIPPSHVRGQVNKAG
jgi:hypothetical protein